MSRFYIAWDELRVQHYNNVSQQPFFWWNDMQFWTAWCAKSYVTCKAYNLTKFWLFGLINFLTQRTIVEVHFHLEALFLPLVPCPSWAASSSSRRSSKLPIASTVGVLFHLTSGTPSGGRTTLMTSLIRRYFMIRSAAVVELSDGEALT